MHHAQISRVFHEVEGADCQISYVLCRRPSTLMLIHHLFEFSLWMLTCTKSVFLFVEKVSFWWAWTRCSAIVLSDYQESQKLLPHIKGNIGFVFAARELKEVHDLIVANKVAPLAHAGALALWMSLFQLETRVWNPAIPPSRYWVFPPKFPLVRLREVHDRWNSCRAIRGSIIEHVVQIFELWKWLRSLDTWHWLEGMIDRFMSGLKTIVTIPLALKYPTLVSITHYLVNSYRNFLAIGIQTDYTFEVLRRYVSPYLPSWFISP